MFSTQSQCGLPSNYQESYIYDENLLCSYAQDHLGAHPSGMGGWYAPACSFEASPWAWQWGEGIRTQEVCDVSQSLQFSLLNEYRFGRVPPLTTNIRRVSHGHTYNLLVLWTKPRRLSPGRLEAQSSTTTGSRSSAPSQYIRSRRGSGLT